MPVSGPVGEQQRLWESERRREEGPVKGVGCFGRIKLGLRESHAIMQWANQAIKQSSDQAITQSRNHTITQSHNHAIKAPGKSSSMMVSVQRSRVPSSACASCDDEASALGESSVTCSGASHMVR
eukprot:1343138-Prymnesium_polylepis.1